MKQTTRNILAATRYHRALSVGQRAQLAYNLRHAKAFTGFLTVRWSEYLGRFVVWTATYIPSLSV